MFDGQLFIPYFIDQNNGMHNLIFFNMWNSFKVTTFKTKRALRHSLMRFRSERFATDCKLNVTTVTLKLQANIDTDSTSFPTRHTGWSTFIYLAKRHYYWFWVQKYKPLGKIFEVDADKGRWPNLKSRNIHVVSICWRFEFSSTQVTFNDNTV